MENGNNLFPNLPERLKGLGIMAENLWWSWNPTARMLFKMLDRQLWKDSGHNPDRMLRELPAEVLGAAARNKDYLRHFDVVLSRFNQYTEETKTCFSEVGKPDKNRIAYFSAEYGLHHSLPFYAGGLGFLAGDHIKECSDLRVPLVAVGFMYPEGYLHQRLLDDGWQEHDSQILDRDVAPIIRVMDDKKKQLIVQVPQHGEVTRNIWQCLWPDIEESRIPVEHVTNGVHVPTWVDPKMAILFNKYLGPDWHQSHDDPVRWELIDEIPDQELWNTHYWLKIKLIDAIRERIRRRWANDRVSPSRVVAGGIMLDPAVLTIGFARRFATYKRADLIFTNPDRLKAIINNRRQPVQFIFAGKAHPADDPGKRLLQRIYNECRNPDYGGRIAFVENYGEQLAQYLVHGVDVWLNTPMPPLEASGTSGMKAALNGIPSLSVPDGWWIEGYNGNNGWSFGDPAVKENRWDEDADALYRTIEEQIVPTYYAQSETGLPEKWVEVMKNTIKSNAAKFSARRMVKEYIEKFYQQAVKEIPA